jgi:hypothetical protein
MENAVSLREVVGEMDLVTENGHSYVNKLTGKLITFFDEDVEVVESGEDLSDYEDWQKETFAEIQQALSSDDYIELPGKQDIHEYAIMENFCLSVENSNMREMLLANIRGAGAFRRFRNAIIRQGIEKDWYRYKDQAYKQIAIQWLGDNGMAYTDDL